MMISQVKLIFKTFKGKMELLKELLKKKKTFKGKKASLKGKMRCLPKTKASTQLTNCKKTALN